MCTTYFTIFWGCYLWSVKYYFYINSFFTTFLLYTNYNIKILTIIKSINIFLYSKKEKKKVLLLYIYRNKLEVSKSIASLYWSFFYNFFSPWELACSLSFHRKGKIISKDPWVPQKFQVRLKAKAVLTWPN